MEHPYLLTLAEQGVPIYGLNYKDEPIKAREWLAQLGDPYQLNVVDVEGSVGLDLGVYGAPETYLIDAQGNIRYKFIGVIDDRVWDTNLAARYQALVEEAQ